MTPDCTAMLAARRDALILYCMSILGSYQDGEDAVQMTALKAWRGWEGQSCDSERAVVAWLYRIAHNECLDELRRRHCRPQSAGAFDDLLRPSDENVEETVLMHERLGEVNAAMGRLSPVARTMVILTAHHYSQEAVGRQLGYTRGATRSAVSRAREAMRARMERAA